MKLIRTIRIDAPAERVWTTMIDVERWPTWTASVAEAVRLDERPFEVGARFRLRQPRLPVAEWVVTAVQPGRSFAWETRSPGLTVVGVHALVPDGAGVTVTLELEQRGLLAPLVGWLTRSLTERYVELEAEGLKRVCERTGAPPPGG